MSAVKAIYLGLGIHSLGISLTIVVYTNSHFRKEFIATNQFWQIFTKMGET